MNTKIFTRFAFIAFFFFLIGFNNELSAVHSVNESSLVVEKHSCTIPFLAPIQIHELKDLRRKEVEKRINRKLKFKERILFRMLKRHSKRTADLPDTEDSCELMAKRAKGSVALGIIGLVFAGLILGFVAILSGSKAVKLARANPDCPDAASLKKKGTAGMILGIIGMIGSILVLVLVL